MQRPNKHIHKNQHQIIGRRLVIPDIHGCYQTLLGLMDQVNPDKNDQIYFLGDYIDRGPASGKVLDYMLYLINSEYPVFPLRGNHEQMLLDVAKFDKQSLKGHARTYNILDLIMDGRIIPKYFDFLNNLPYFFELKDFYLVHAGFNFLSETPFEDKKAMLWIRQFMPDNRYQHNKQIIYGHDPEPLPVIKKAIASKTLKIPLDNGCVYTEARQGFGNLLCLNLDTFELLIQKNIDY